MGNIIYNIFLKAYVLAFNVVALFNNKARLGLQGRKNIFNKITRHPLNSNQQLVWIHCASLGEFEQGRPVLEALKKQYANINVVLTFFSASGYEAMKNYKGADQIIYLPFDSKANAIKMLDTLNPTLVLWVKYEFWFHYLNEMKRRDIPVLLISGIFRASHPFFKWYGGLWRKILQCFTHIFVQNEISKNLVDSLSVQKNVSITGDTRFDRVIEIAENFVPLPLIEKFCGDHKILVAGSTWEDDEAELIHYVRANPQMKFIIAPHEIDAGNLLDVQKEFTNAILYSALITEPPSTINDTNLKPNVLIIDNVGMLSRLYYYADITYVGGAFGADGVHNVLEAAVYGKPVIYGPEFEKFSEAIDLINCGGGITIENALELESTLNEFWQNNELLISTGEAAKNYVFSNAGASNKIMAFIQEKRLLIN